MQKIEARFAGLGFFIVDVKRKLQFSIATVWKMLSSLVMFLVQVSLWSYIGLRDDPTYIVRYFAIVVFIRPIINQLVEREIEGLHATGRIVYDVVRPISLIRTLFLRTTSKALVALLTVSMPVMVCIAIFADLGTFSYRILPIFIVSVGAGYTIAWLISFTVGSSVFRLKDANGVLSAYNFLFPFFAGAVLPIEALPRPFRLLMSVLPFRAAYDLPIRIANCSTLVDTLPWIALQMGWLSIALLAALFAQKRSLKYLEIFGG